MPHKNSPSMGDVVMQRITTKGIKIMPTWWFLLGTLTLSLGTGILLILTGLAWRLLWTSALMRNVLSLWRMGTMGRQVLWSAFPWEWLLLGLGSMLVGAGLVRQFASAYKYRVGTWLLALFAGSVITAFGFGVLQTQFNVLDIPPLQQYLRQSFVGQQYLIGSVSYVNGQTATLVTPNGEDVDVWLRVSPPTLSPGERVLLIGQWRDGRFEATGLRRVNAYQWHHR